MYLDSKLILADAQAVTTDAPSANVLDLQTDRDIGAGTEEWVVVQVDEAATAAGAATVTFSFETDSASNFSTKAVLYKSDAVGKAALVPGYRLAFRVPRGTKRYNRLFFTVANGPLTAGKFTAFVTGVVPSDQRYPQAAKVFG